MMRLSIYRDTYVGAAIFGGPGNWLRHVLAGFPVKYQVGRTIISWLLVIEIVCFAA